ncbi:MAG: hypothetical protein ACYTKD_19995 [Planctomycetota bacterium]|jgi:hypothetical protein
MKEIATVLWFSSASVIVMAHVFLDHIQRGRSIVLLFGPVIALMMSLVGIVSVIRKKELPRFKVLPCALGVILALISLGLLVGQF